MKTGLDRIGRTVTIERAHRQCFDKVHYATRNAARDRAAYVARKYPNSQPQRPYKCALCRGFHLATQRADKGKDTSPNGRRTAGPKQCPSLPKEG